MSNHDLLCMIQETIFYSQSLPGVVDGKVQNMDPLRGPGPSKYGPGPWTPYFYKLRLHHEPLMTRCVTAPVSVNHA